MRDLMIFLTDALNSIKPLKAMAREPNSKSSWRCVSIT